MKLCIFTFSPVQSFISQSRKLSDLFNSSFILSYLTERLIERIKEEKLGEVIYPVYGKELEGTDLAGYPNRLVLESEKCVCEDLRKYLEEVWEELCLDVRASLGLSGRVAMQFENHVRGHFQSFCHCEEYVNKDKWLSRMKLEEVDDAEDYGYTYDLVERYLGAIKSFRPYSSRVDTDAYEGKYPDGCTLCGERPALALNWETFSKGRSLMLKKGERLCGVCLTKRFALEHFTSKGRLTRKSFPSTKDLAWARLKHELIRDKNNKKNLEYITAIESAVNQIMKRADEKFITIKDINADWLDPEDVRKMKEEAGDEGGLYDELLEALERLYHTAGYKKPENSYFAILMMDGDNMGKWLGLSRELREEKLSKEFHENFSKKLSEFASVVYKKSKSYGVFVELVYAGGDDVLAVGYPEALLCFARRVREEFSKTLNSGKATMSAGFVVGHENENLRFLLEEVRRAEKKAKDADKEKDKICISVVPRNSEPVRVVLKWDWLELFEEVVEYFRQGLISQGLPYAIREELWIFRKEEKHDATELAKTLLKRALWRKSRLKELDGKLEELVNSLERMGFLKKIEALEAFFYSARFLSKLEGVHEVVSA